MNVLHACLKRTKEQLITENELSPQEGQRIFAHLICVDVDASGNPLYTTTEADRAVEIDLLSKRYGRAELEIVRELFRQQAVVEQAKASAIIKHPAASSSNTMGTAEMAERLNVTQAHARRLIVTKKDSWKEYRKGRNWDIPRKLAEEFIKTRRSTGGLK